MAVKGSRRLLRECYNQVLRITDLAPLSHRALQLGLGTENTAGHIHHAFGAVQLFLEGFPQHKQVIAAASPLEAYRINGQIEQDWMAFIAGKHGEFGPRGYRYNWDKLRRVLTPRCGGTRAGGGGGDNEFEIVLRLAATLF